MKVQTASRIDGDLLELAKERARAQRRSLSNYVENLLYMDIGNIPNDATEIAIEEARIGKGLEKVGDLDEFMDDL